MHRKKLTYYLRFACVLAALPAAASAVAAPPELPPAYKILRHKSIFSRDRITYTRRSRPPRPAPPPRPMAPVFIGVLRDGPNVRALLESPQDGSITAVHAHSVVPGPFGGLISRITLRNLEIMRRGKPPQTVILGENLLGASAAVPASASASGPGAVPATGPAAGASGPPVSPAQSRIIEMLRRQRQQENK